MCIRRYMYKYKYNVMYMHIKSTLYAYTMYMYMYLRGDDIRGEVGVRDGPHSEVDVLHGEANQISLHHPLYGSLHLCQLRTEVPAHPHTHTGKKKHTPHNIQCTCTYMYTCTLYIYSMCTCIYMYMFMYRLKHCASTVWELSNKECGQEFKNCEQNRFVA